MAVSWISTCSAGWWVLAMFVHLASICLALAQPWMRHRRLMPATEQPVTVIIPLKYLDYGFDTAQRSILSQVRDEDEIFVSTTDKDSAARDRTRALLAQYPRLSAHVIAVDPAVALSPKLNNIATPIALAARDMIFVKDSNIVLDDGQFVRLLRHMTPGVGLVTVATRAEAAENLPARIEAALMNGHQAPIVLAASALGLGFGLGKVLLFSRAAFMRGGGIPAIANVVAEDQAMAQLFARQGLRTVIAGDIARQPLGRRRLIDLWQRQLRWMICRRFDAQPAFILEPFFAALCTILFAFPAASALGTQGWQFAIFTCLVWYATETLFLALKGWNLVSPLAWCCREFLIVLLWLRAWTTRDVVWAGRRMDVRGRGWAKGQTG